MQSKVWEAIEGLVCPVWGALQASVDVMARSIEKQDRIYIQEDSNISLNTIHISQN